MTRTHKLHKTPLMRAARKAQADRLKALRIDADLTFKTLSEWTMIPMTNLKYAERDMRFLTVPELMTLAALYSVSVDWIINGGQLRRPLKTAIDHVPDRIKHEQAMR